MASQSARYASERDLRLRAIERIAGNAGVGPQSSSAAALSVLYELASSPSTSAAALALLHELQVHQVEVEMQEEELQRSRVELEASLARHIRLYDLAPFAYFTVDAATRLCELNLAGARLLRGDPEMLLGQAFDGYLLPQSASVLHAALSRVRDTGRAQSFALQLAANPAQTGSLHARAAPDPKGGAFLLAVVDPTP